MTTGILAKIFEALFRSPKRNRANPIGQIERNETPTTNNITVYQLDFADEEPPPNVWYQQFESKHPNLCRWNASYSKDWRIFASSKVAGSGYHNRENSFFSLASIPDFHVLLRPEPLNPVDQNAIAIDGQATIEGQKIRLHLGYVEKEIVRLIGEKDDEVSAVPDLVWLPTDSCQFGWQIKLLERSNAYRKRNQKHFEV